VTFDPKAEFERCETLMLDMDGTVLDLAYDNFMWLTHVPRCWAEINGMSFDEARAHLAARYGKIQGELHWYCLDHWSERLGLDVMQLHRDNHERIGYLPGAREFLEVVCQRDIRLLLVTNSHPDTLQLKDDVTGLSRFFDGVHSAHSYGFAKEESQFWDALRAAEPFDPATTMFVDDTHRVLRSAARYGVAKPVVVTRPDTSVPHRENGEFVGVEGVAGLLS
jgi:putative hydrolase of the HAD superfamily